MLKLRSSLAAVAAALTLAAVARAQEAPALPEDAIGQDTQVVVTIDLESLEMADLQKSVDALADAIPDANAESRTEFQAKSKESLTQMEKAKAELTGAGVKSMVVLGEASMQGDVDVDVRVVEEGVEGSGEGGVEGGVNGNGGMDFGDDEFEDEQQKPTLLIEVASGAEPAKVQQAMRNAASAMNQLNEESGQEIDLSEVEVKAWSDGWMAVTGPDLAEAKKIEGASRAGEFAEALKREEGAPIRMALVLSASQKQQIQQAVNDPEAGMEAAFMQPLTQLNSATGGVYPGASPKIQMAMHFDNAQAATQFKGMTDMMMNMAALGLSQQAQQAGPEGGDPQAVMAMVQSLMLKQEGSTLSTRLGADLLTQMKKAGIDWTQMGDESGDEWEDDGEMMEGEVMMEVEEVEVEEMEVELEPAGTME